MRTTKEVEINMPEFQRILCPVDFSEPSHVGLETAVEMADRFSAELLIVHVVRPVPLAAVPQPTPAFDVVTYQNELAKSAKEGMEKLVREHVPDGIRARTLVARGDPAQEIARTADEEKADLAVMATHGESGWQRFVFGSVTEKTVRVSPCPVLTVPEPRDK